MMGVIICAPQSHGMTGGVGADRAAPFSPYILTGWGRKMRLVFQFVELVLPNFARRISHDEAPNSGFGMTRATEDTPHEHSPEVLAARLDAVERRLEERQALYRLRVASTTSHLAKDD